MSHSNDVATRRALRRVVGPELLSFTEDTTQAIRTLQAGITTITQQFAATRVVLDQAIDEVRRLLARAREHEARLDAHASTLVRLTDEHRAFVGRSFLARLRWLFTGR